MAPHESRYLVDHAELAEPFYDGIESQAPAARALARDYFDLDGLCFAWPWYYAAYYHCAGPWYGLYLWWHWLYTGDVRFLRDRAYPIIKGTCEFLERYIERGPDGRWGIWPSISPENRARAEPAYSGFRIVSRNPSSKLT